MSRGNDFQQQLLAITVYYKVLVEADRDSPSRASSLETFNQKVFDTLPYLQIMALYSCEQFYIDLKIKGLIFNGLISSYVYIYNHKLYVVCYIVILIIFICS